MSLSETLHDSIWCYKHESIDEVNDSDTWPKENPNLGHVASYETYRPNDDILAKRFGIPCFTKEEI